MIFRTTPMCKCRGKVDHHLCRPPLQRLFIAHRSPCRRHGKSAAPFFTSVVQRVCTWCISTVSSLDTAQIVGYPVNMTFPHISLLARTRWQWWCAATRHRVILKIKTSGGWQGCIAKYSCGLRQRLRLKMFMSTLALLRMVQGLLRLM